MSTENLGLLVETDDGSFTLRHPDNNEEYHSVGGALLEAQSLYRDASGLITHLMDRNGTSTNINILDVGLGLGYNALTSIEAWLKQKQPHNLNICSLENNEPLVAAFSSAQAPWMIGWSEGWKKIVSQLTLNKENDYLSYQCNLAHPLSPKAQLHWTIILGNALTIHSLRPAQHFIDGYHFIWQDPFSPQKNPDMWSSKWFHKVKSASHPDAILMTYSVARSVRDALQEAAWHFIKIPACGKKKHWLKASLNRSKLTDGKNYENEI